MKITRTERYTDWVFQGAHAGEQAASVGVGLFRGSIYFRHAHDNLQSGDTIDREEFFVELSDGSTYELGTGLSGEKVAITNHGVTSSGDVYLEVVGKPTFGVGVSKVYRNVTISFDDGKVPVLDTEQLNGILDNLKESLSTSMQDTANAVKQEAFAKVDTMGIELKDSCNSTVNAAKAEVEAKVTALDGRFESNKSDVARQMATLNSQWMTQAESLDSKIATVQVDVNNVRKELEAGIQGLNQFNVALWQPTTGKFVGSGLTENIIDSNMVIVQSDNVFTHGLDGSVILKASEYDRVLTITVTAGMVLSANPQGGYWYLFVGDKKGSLLAQSVFPVMASDVKNFYQTQNSVRLFIPRGGSHPAVGDGGVFPKLRNMNKEDITMNNIKIELALQTSFKLQNDPIFPI